MYAIMCENNDAFHSRDCEPLVPTLVERVYANRFTAPGKTLTTLYNARGYTVDGPVLEASVAPDVHFFDLLQCRELPVQKAGDTSAIALKIHPNRTACIAHLPRALSARRTADGFVVTVKPPFDRLRAAPSKVEGPPDKGGQPLELALASRDGERLTSTGAHPGENALRLPRTDSVRGLPASGGDAPQPACIKLLSAGRLVDAIEVPAR
jgi:hypothetical protein